MSIRPAVLADCVILAAIDAEANPSPWSTLQFQTALANHLDTVMIFEQDNQPVAFAVWQILFDESELHLIATASCYRRQGIAGQLMRYWLNQAQNNQVSRLLLEVRESNSAARQFYQKWAFAETGMRKNYYSLPDGTRENAVLMEKLC